MRGNSKTGHQPVRASTAAFVGTMIEWYDFYIYATAAALVFGKLFFPSATGFYGTLAAFGTFAVGFFARPWVARSSGISATASGARSRWSSPC